MAKRSKAGMSRYGVNAKVAGETMELTQEDQNNALIDNLSEKTNMLKELTFMIGEEVRGQNKMLDGMDGEMDDTGSVLGGSMRRLKTLTNNGNNKVMCYLVGFVVFVFIVIYYLAR